MAKSRCPIEKYNLKERLDKCLFEEICNNDYKKICKYNRKLIDKLKISV